MVALGLDPKLVREPLRRYGASVDHLAAIESEWRRLGQPVTASGSTGQVIGHPLLRELRQQTRAVEALHEALVKEHPRERMVRGTRRRGGKVVPLPLPAEVEGAL